MNSADALQQTLDQIYGEVPSAASAMAKLRQSVEEWKEAVWYGSLPLSPVGPLLIAVGQAGVVAIEFGQEEQSFVDRLTNTTHAKPMRSQERVEPVAKQIEQFLSGARREFDLSIDLSTATEFQRRVLRAAASVPAGVVATYGEIARRIGRPRAARAVGQALARNPIPIVVPCHRVVAADGSLTGYSGGGGVETKAQLLRLEGASIA